MRNIHVGQTMRIAITTAIVGSTAINGIGLTASIAHITHKIAKGETPTALELFQITSSALFFTNTLLTVNTAAGHIKNVSGDIRKNDKFRPPPTPRTHSPTKP
jgi:hypothetical protein